MKKLLSVAAILSLGLVGAQHASAVTIIDPEGFADGTVINNNWVGDGVTLSVTDGSGTALVGEDVIAVDPTLSDDPNPPSTGTRSFGNTYTEPDWGNIWSPSHLGGYYLRADFAGSVDSVSIDVIATDDSEAAALFAYNSGGTEIGMASVAFGTAINGNTVETLTLLSPSEDIAYILASGFSGATVGLDNLQFTESASVPDGGATLALLVCGLAAVRGLRRKL